MLRATQTPVQDIALASGFADANTFCRAYRQKFGTPPGQARKPAGLFPAESLERL
jgi:transcriptional regulator GlxA family with amidase domain